MIGEGEQSFGRVEKAGRATPASRRGLRRPLELCLPTTSDSLYVAHFAARFD